MNRREMKKLIGINKYLIELLLIILLVILTACNNDKEEIEGSIIITPEWIDHVPTEITFEGYSYILEAYIYRDFMPGVGPEGSNLIAGIHLIESDSLAIPNGVDIDLLWVVNGSFSWVVEYDFEHQSHPDYTIEKVAHGGPKWGPDIFVDAVVRVTSETGETHYIKIKDQMIGSTS
jgi:hypothetical protein